MHGLDLTGLLSGFLISGFGDFGICSGLSLATDFRFLIMLHRQKSQNLQIRNLKILFYELAGDLLIAFDVLKCIYTCSQRRYVDLVAGCTGSYNLFA
jgi:hypothetical protein